MKQTQRGQNTGEQNEQEDRERERERRQIQTKNEYRESERKQRETWKEKKTREEDQEQRDKENPGEHKINEERFLGFLPGLQQRNVCCLLNNRSPNHPKTKETETDTNRDRENKKSKKKPSKEKQDQKRSTKKKKSEEKKVALASQNTFATISFPSVPAPGKLRFPSPYILITLLLFTHACRLKKKNRVTDLGQWASNRLACWIQPI